MAWIDQAETFSVHSGCRPISISASGNAWLNSAALLTPLFARVFRTRVPSATSITRRPVVRNKRCESGVKIGVPDPKRPIRPALIEPPPSPNKEFCPLPGVLCAERNKGRWNNESNSSDCPPL